MHKRTLPAVIIASAALFFSLAGTAQAVTLVRPDGQPVGGTMQQWANHARVPTARVIITFEPVSQLCQLDGTPFQTDGCSVNLFGSSPDLLAASDRDALYAELGHIFDWTTLTSASQAAFRRIWHVPSTTRWQNTTSALMRGQEDGLEGDFSAAYALCAEGHGDFHYMQSAAAPIIHQTPGATCRLIEHAARA